MSASRVFARLCLAAVLLLSGLIAPAARAEGDPKAVIQQLSDALLDAMKHAQELGFDGRAKRLQPAVAAAYDMAAMTKATLGVSATKLSAEDADKLARAYTRFSVATYADQFDGFSGERFQVGTPRPADNGMVVVPSQIINSAGAPTEIDYLMHESNGHWTIVDVLFDGTVSQVAVRRSEFVTIFRKDGLDGLLSMLDSKAAALGKK